MRNIILLIFLLICTVVVLPCGSTLAEEAKVKVLAILPLTGNMSVFGDAVKNGMELALKNISAIEVTFEDDGSQPKNTVSALQKNLAIRRPDCVVAASSQTSKSISPILEREKIPFIAIATDEEISKGKSYSLNFWVTPDIQAQVLLDEARKRGYKKIALFSTVHEGTMSIKRKFEEVNKGTIEVLHDEEFPGEVKDFRSLISRFKAKTKDEKLDAIFVNVFFDQIGLFAKQLRQLGIDLPLFSIETFEDENAVKISGGALIDQWYVNADDPGAAFLKLYSNTFKGSGHYGAANGHDAVLLISDAASKGNKHSAAINDYLHNVKDFKGALGTFSSTNDNRFTLPAVVKIVTKDGFIIKK